MGERNKGKCHKSWKKKKKEQKTIPSEEFQEVRSLKQCSWSMNRLSERQRSPQCKCCFNRASNLHCTGRVLYSCFSSKDDILNVRKNSVPCSPAINRSQSCHPRTSGITSSAHQQLVGLSLY